MSVRRTLALAAGAALLLAGCGGDPEPRFEPPPSPSPSESETGAEPEAQSPEAFIREWFRAGTRMQNTGQTETVRALSPGCKACLRLADQVERIYESGGFVKIASQEVTRVKQLSETEFTAVVDAAPTEYKESRSAEVTQLPGGPNKYRIVLEQRGGAWVMSEYWDTPS